MKRLFALVVAMAVVACGGTVLLTRTGPGAVAPAEAAAPVARTSAATPSAPIAAPAATTGAAITSGVGTARATTAPARRPARASATAPAPAPARKQAVKKGASVWAGTGVGRAIEDSGASWYYTWAAHHDDVTTPKGVEFVPMIWGAQSVTAANLAAAKRNGSTLLGFNEPDLAGQAEMTVEQALALWPKLQATGLALGSPAVAYGADRAGGWLDRFMAGAKQKGYRVDFVTLHWYGADFSSARAVQQLKGYLDAVHRRYGKPVWLTEYALMNFSAGAQKYPSAATQAAFVTASTAMLQKLPYLRRYAWFALPTSTDGSEGTGLYRDGVANASGRAYRAAG